jgi:stage III sporulation protein AA
MEEAFILNFLDKDLQKEIKNFLNQDDSIQEIRLRVDKPVEIINNKRNFFLNLMVSRKVIDSTLNTMTNYSLYSLEDELRNGFITLKGGYRIGIVGKVVTENGYIKTIKDISGLNIRFSREVKGAGDKIIPYIIKENSIFHILIVSPPQCGKTTIIRDISRQISNGVKNPKLDSLKVGIVDERSEIAGCYQGIPQNDVGLRTDVLDACPKAFGITIRLFAFSKIIKLL